MNNEDFDEMLDDSFDSEKTEVLTQENKCTHEITFLYPGQGKYDVYQCKKCNEIINKSWNNTATTTYKDRV